MKHISVVAQALEMEDAAVSKLVARFYFSLLHNTTDLKLQMFAFRQCFNSHIKYQDNISSLSHQCKPENQADAAEAKIRKLIHFGDFIFFQ